MSKSFLAILVVIFAAFAGYELWLNLHLRAVNDSVIEVCFKPAIVPPRQRILVYSAEEVRHPMSYGVMTR